MVDPSSIPAISRGLSALARPLDKLMGPVARWVGSEARPRQIRREAAAKADATVIQASARSVADDIEFAGKLGRKAMEIDFEEGLQRRAVARLIAQQTREQANIEAVVAVARDALPRQVSNEPVTEQWLDEFFNHCRRATETQLRDVWGRVLAREVANPGSTSLRTLTILRTLEVDEANLFERVCAHAVQAETSWLLILGEAGEEAWFKWPDVDDLRVLLEAGLLDRDVKQIAVKRGSRIRHGDLLGKIPKGHPIEVQGAWFTTAGQELAQIVRARKAPTATPFSRRVSALFDLARPSRPRSRIDDSI